MTKKGTGLKIAISAVLCLFILVLAIRQGSVYISLKDLFGIIGGHITGKGTPEGVEPMMDSIFWLTGLRRTAGTLASRDGALSAASKRRMVPYSPS